MGGTTGDAGRAALSGLGGVDKTQTAVEYAHRYSKEYDYIFWVSAASREGLLSGYATIAGLLKLAEAGAQDQTLAVGAVHGAPSGTCLARRSNRHWMRDTSSSSRIDSFGMVLR